jgi:hypothetical protein
MNNPVARRALLALSHPLSIAALLILLLNDHWLKKVAPSWLTGSSSDIAACLCPFRTVSPVSVCTADSVPQA